jgi:hypothetical protein
MFMVAGVAWAEDDDDNYNDNDGDESFYGFFIIDAYLEEAIAAGAADCVPAKLKVDDDDIEDLVSGFDGEDDDDGEDMAEEIEDVLEDIGKNLIVVCRVATNDPMAETLTILYKAFFNRNPDVVD